MRISEPVPIAVQRPSCGYWYGSLKKWASERYEKRLIRMGKKGIYNVPHINKHSRLEEFDARL